MSKIDDLKAEIERLPSNEFAELFQWLSEKDWEHWDRQIQNDSEGGKLDFLIQEAHREKRIGSSRACDASHDRSFLGLFRQYS